MMIRFHRFVYSKPADDFDGGGGVSEPVETDLAEPAQVETGDVGDKPASMFDAISQALETPEEKAERVERARDEKGRFATKAEADAALKPEAKQDPAKPAPAQTPKDPNAKPTPEELTQMPEGLTPKAQQRFQQLANTAKEVSLERDSFKGQVDYVKEVFQSNGVKAEQFEQAASVIGMMNKGDFAGALQVIDQQREMIALAMGRPLPGVDPLSRFQDLREAVDSYQITEPHALEIAQGRMVQGSQQQAQQRQEQEAQSHQAAEVEHQRGTMAVDQFCKRMQDNDLDYQVIEDRLLPHLPKLLQGVPPRQWASVVETQYNMIKDVAGNFRRSTPSTGSTLRPTGQESPAAAPKTMFEAMWGQSAPRA